MPHKRTKRSGKRKHQSKKLSLIPRGQIAANSTQAELVFSKTIAVTNGGTTFSSVRFNPTFAYDVDPTVGSTAIAGFTEWGTLYRAYRVLGARLKFSVVNQDAITGTVTVAGVNYDPGANYIHTQYLEASPFSKSRVLGVSTGGNAGWAGSLSFRSSKMIGIPEPEIRSCNELYATTAGSAVTNPWFFHIGWNTAANQTNGILLYCQIFIDILFSELGTPPT